MELLHGLYKKYQNREEVIKTIQDSAKGFYFLALITFIAGLVFVSNQQLGFMIFFDAGLYLLFGFLLGKFNSKLAAIFLLFMSLATVMSTVGNILKPQSAQGGSNIILSVIVLIVSISAVRATFLLKNFPLKKQE